MDKYVGQKVRIFRLQKATSQAELREAVDITFQQIQSTKRASNKSALGAC
jgi:hypothetical protein